MYTYIDIVFEILIVIDIVLYVVVSIYYLYK